MKYIKNGKIISASEKAYKTIYAAQGYLPENEAINLQDEPEDTSDEVQTVNIAKMKVADLKALAKENGVLGADSLNRDKLIELLKDVV